MTDEKSENLAAVNALIVSGISCGKEGPVELIKVPKAYLRSFLPVEMEKVTTLTKIKKWKYSNPITAEITKDDDNKVGMMIGANCMKAVEPVEIIAGQYGGPYACKTKLAGVLLV